MLPLMAQKDPVQARALARRVLDALSPGGIAVAIGFAVAAAVALNPVFVTPFIVLLGRTLFVSLLLLAVFVGAQRVPEHRLPRWLPRWLFTVLAVALAAPLGTLAVYFVSVQGQVGQFFGSEPRLAGFFIIASTALVLGLLITLTAQLREREARARALALEFELERTRLEKQAVDARLALLQAQIEPHFLFNTLANVQALVETRSPRARDVLASLIAYLRAAMPRLQDRASTLADEESLVRAYLELMQMRMPDRLGFDIRIDPALQRQPFPPMALLTLVENAVQHGIDPCERGGHIDIGGQRDGGAVKLWVSDDGQGMSEHAQPGTGLTNLRARLAAAFGPEAALDLQERAPHGLRAEIRFPAALA